MGLKFVVGSFTAESLIRPAVRNAGNDAACAKPRRQHVQKLFNLSEEEAVKLCRTFGASPNELAGGCPLCEAEAECLDPFDGVLPAPV